MIQEPGQFLGRSRELNRILSRIATDRPQSLSVVGADKLIQLEDLPTEMWQVEMQSSPPSSFHEAVEQKKEIIVDAVIRAGGKMTEAANSLKLQPTYLHRLVRNLNLRGEIAKRMKGK